MHRALRWMTMALLALPMWAHAEGDAFFGFHWGQTPDQLRAQGIHLIVPKDGGQEGNFRVFYTEQAPKPFSRAEGYVLLFDQQAGLIKVRMGFEVHNDPTGQQGTEAFDEVSDLLASKYKIDPEHTRHETGRALYTKPDEFYQCLHHTGCGLWADAYLAPNKFMVVQLRGNGPGEGTITLTAEAIPEFDQAQARQTVALRQKDRDAL